MNKFKEQGIMRKLMIVVMGVILILTMNIGIFAEENVMFNYQGRVKVQGNAFTGTGNFKFAIVNNAGDDSLWSNDGTSTGGGEPAASIAISVADGIFNVMVGDTALGMVAINRTVFNHPSQIKLRTWFSDGTHGFQQLLPDQKLVNVELLGIRSGTDDFTIYVNGATGDDQHNGLTPEKAKKTIQAAVDVLPERIRSNVTIKVAPGTYQEEVLIEGITVKSGKMLYLKGDETWTPTGGGEPNVRITGTDNLETPVITRANGIGITNVFRIEVVGFQIDYASCGIGFGGGYGKIKNCRVSKNNRGIDAEDCIALLYDVIATQNQGAPLDSGVGLLVSNNSHVEFLRCQSTYNQGIGLRVQNHSAVSIIESGKFSNNGSMGIWITSLSRVWFATGYSGEIKNNTSNGIDVREYSYTLNYSLNTISGNLAPEVTSSLGGIAYP